MSGSIRYITSRLIEIKRGPRFPHRNLILSFAEFSKISLLPVNIATLARVIRHPLLLFPFHFGGCQDPFVKPREREIDRWVKTTRGDGLPKKDLAVYDSSPFFNSSTNPFESVHSPNNLPSICSSLPPLKRKLLYTHTHTHARSSKTRVETCPIEKVHANLQTNDNWTTPFSLPFLSNLSRDICWNLATVKILIFSGAHRRSTTIHSIVCHRLKNGPCGWIKPNYWEIRAETRLPRGREKTKPCSSSKSRRRNAGFAIQYRSPRTSLSVFIARGEQLWKRLGPRKLLDRNKPANSVYSVYYEFYDYV